MTLDLAGQRRASCRSHLLRVASPSFLCLLPSLPSDRRLSSNSQDSPLVASTHQARIAQSRWPTHRLAQAAAPIRLAPLTALASRAQFGIPSPCWKYLGNILVHFLIPFCLRSFGLLVTLALAVEYLYNNSTISSLFGPVSPVLHYLLHVEYMYINLLSWPQPRTCKMQDAQPTCIR